MKLRHDHVLIVDFVHNFVKMSDNSMITQTGGCAECGRLQKELGISESVDAKKERRLTTTGKVLLGVFGTTFVGISAVCLPFVLPALRKVKKWTKFASRFLHALSLDDKIMLDCTSPYLS